TGRLCLAEATARLRSGNVSREAGYDGECGVIRLFEESELKRLTAGGLLFDAPISKRAASARPKPRVRNDALADNRESVAPARPRLRLISGDSAASLLLAPLHP